MRNAWRGHAAAGSDVCQKIWDMEMRGKVTCRFIGGPNGDQVIALAAMHCQDALSLVSETWIAESRDGGFVVMKGHRTPRTPWVTFSRDNYKKVIPVEPGNVTYQFIGTVQVNRCAKLLSGKGRRCGNEAENQSEFCRVHQSTS